MPMDEEKTPIVSHASVAEDCDTAIFMVHGIHTAKGDIYGPVWLRSLGPEFSETKGVEGRWNSTGTAMGDVFQIMMRKKKREAAIEDMTDALLDFMDLPHKKKLLLAHSMGEPLLCAAIRRTQCKLPLVTIGGPLSNPMFGNALATVGLRAPTPGERPVRFWNRHDGVCCSRVFGARQPAWMDAIRIAVAGDTGWIVEHDAVLYLENENVRAACRYALDIVGG